MAFWEFRGVNPPEIRIPEAPRHLEPETFNHFPDPERYPAYSHTWLMPGNTSTPEQPALVVASPPGGFFYAAQQISLETQRDTDIRYTLDGADPDATADLYVSPIALVSPCVLKARAYRGGQTAGPVVAWTYEIRPPVTLTATPSPGIHYADVTVRIQASDATAEIRYSLDDTAPDLGADLWPGEMAFSRPAAPRIRARAFSEWEGLLYAAGDAVLYAYTLRLPAVVHASPAGGIIGEDGMVVTLSSPDPEVTIRYTVDNAPPVAASPAYTAPMTFHTTTHLCAMAFFADTPVGPSAAWEYLLLAPMAHGMVMRWESSSHQGTDLTVTLAWSDAAGLNNTFIDMVWEFLWGRAQSADQQMLLHWSAISTADAAHETDWSDIGVADAAHEIGWSDIDVADTASLLAWGDAVTADHLLHLVHSPAIGVDYHQALLWDMAAALDMERDLRWRMGLCADKPMDAIFSAGSAADHGVALPWGLGGWTPHDPDPENPPPPGVWIEARRDVFLPFFSAGTYLMNIQNITCRRVSDNAPVVLVSGNVRTDKNSWAWNFSGTVASAEHAALLMPGNGTSVEIELVVQGYPFRFLIDEVNPSLSWSKGAWSVSGYSPSVEELGDGSPSISRIFTETTGQQIAAGLLQETGWGLEWEIPVNLWPVNGEYSVSGVPGIQVLKDLAEAVGAGVYTHRHEKKICMKTLYPCSVWELATQEPDDLIVQGIIEIGRKNVRVPGYDSVFVSGTVSGSFVRVVREGKAGGRPAPGVADPLLTVPWTNRERGRCILNRDGVNRMEHTLLVPLFPAGSGKRPGLLEPLRVVDVSNPDTDAVFRGVTASIDISFGISASGEPSGVWQRVLVEEYHV